MGLLDGDLREVFGSVFAPLLLDAVITRVTLIPDGAGGMSESSVSANAKGMVEKYSAYERAQLAIPATDVKLILLQKDVGLVPDVHSQITIRGQLYSVQGIEEDPAQASWTIQGRPVFVPLGVQVNAAASAVAGVGRPRLILLINKAAEAVAQALPPANPISLDAAASAIAGAGAPVRLVPVMADAAAVAETGVPAVDASGFAAEVIAVAGAGTPQVRAAVSGEAAAIAGAGVPLRLVRVAAPATAIAEVEGPSDNAVLISASAVAIAGVGTVQRLVQVSAEAEAVLTAPVPFQAAGVHVDGEAVAVAGAGTVTRRVPVDARAGAIAAAAAPLTVTALVTAGATAIADVSTPFETPVRVSAGASLVASAGTPVRRVPVPAEAASIAGVGTVLTEIHLNAEAVAIAGAGTVTRIVPVAAPAEAVAEVGAVEVGRWTPEAFGADAVLWFDADDFSTLTLSGSDVTAWANKGSLAGSVTPATSTIPDYSATARNGRPGVVNTGGTFGNSLNGNFDGLPLGNSSHTIIAVAYLQSNNAVDYNSVVQFGTSSANQLRGLWGNNGSVVMGFNNGSANDYFPGVSWYLSDQIMSLEYDGSDREMSGVINGEAVAPVTRAMDAATTGTLCRVISGGALIIQELIVLNRVLTATEREKLHGHLAHKWSLTGLLSSEHPYKSAPPAA